MITNVPLMFLVKCHQSKHGTKTDTRKLTLTSQVRKTVRSSLRSAFLALLPIGLGILKVYLHYYSRFRYGFLDYLVAAGAILGGAFLLSRKPSSIILLISGSFIAVEAFKAIIDRHDIFDVSLAIISIVYLSIPFLRFIRQHTRPAH